MNISLIGMMGAGKTTIGKLLAEQLQGFSFIDIDEEIVRREKKSINEIFKEYKEPYFRKKESEVLKEILNRDNTVISTGGGIVKSKENIKLLKEKSIVIYLKADCKTLFERIKNNKERPLLNSGDMENLIKTLLNERFQYYEEGHIIINTPDKKIDIILKEIMEKIRSYGKN